MGGAALTNNNQNKSEKVDIVAEVLPTLVISQKTASFTQKTCGVGEETSTAQTEWLRAPQVTNMLSN